MPKLWTIGQLAEHFNRPIHVLKYAIATYKVDHRQRIGTTRLWFDEDLPAIKAALNRTAARNTQGAK